MRSANFYPQTFRENNAKGNGFIRTVLLAGLLLLALPFAGWASVPGFVSASPQSRTICGGGIATNINSWLVISDIDPGKTDTWNELGSPLHGTLGGFPATRPSGGSGIPSGLTYTPFFNATNDTFSIIVDDGLGSTAVMVVYVTINPGPTLTLGTVNPICAGVANATLPFTALHNVGPDTVMFNFTGSPESWTVPANVTSLKFDLFGASGGNDNISGNPNPGKGGRIQGTLSVTPGHQLFVRVGGVGGDGTVTGGLGGYNGGGNSQFYFYGAGGAGGGATDIRVDNNSLSSRKVVAGGGGGNGADNTLTSTFLPYAGGNGGGTTGGNSANNEFGSHAGGGTLSSGGAAATSIGATPATPGSSGQGGAGSSTGISGGGGGGYFGGGGGVWTGGGGGSSYADPLQTLAVTHTQGANIGDGMATLYYINPGTYDLIWDAAAFDSGFVNVANRILPSGSEFNIDVPVAVSAGTYNAVLRIRNASCTSTDYPVSLTVKPKPSVATPANQYICNGGTTADVFLFTSVSGGSVSWTNDNPAIGLPTTGTPGHIPAFTPVNTTNDPVVANITIRPVADGCFGDSTTFQIVDNPVPQLNSTATPAGICNNQLFSYVPNSLTVGTDFDWSRAAITDINNPAQSGTDNPNENLLNIGLEPVNVVYVYTLTANGCVNTVNVTVQVNPTPVFTSTLTPSPVCNNAPFNYTPASSTTAAVFTWTRATTSGISNPAASGSGNISETLVNTTNSPKTVTYVYSMDVNGCITTQNISVVVNPTPALLSNLTLNPICDSTLFIYTPVPAVPGSAISWTRPAVAGITPATNSGTDGVSEVLRNTAPDAKTVNYLYTMTANGCSYTQTVSVLVNPRPTLTTTLTPTGICTNTMFNYTPATATTGTTITWARDTVEGISNMPATGTNSVHEILYNTSETPRAVVYLYTLTANGCPNSQAVVVTVNPLPRLSNDVSALAVCDSTLFNFVPASNTPGASFAWTRAYVAGVSNLNASGTGSPNELLNNTTYITVDVPYVYTITAAGCSNTQSIVVSVRPSPILSTSHTAAACTGLPFTYVPVSYTPATTFTWSRVNVPGITPATASGSGNINDTLTQSGTGTTSVVYVYTLTVTGTVCYNTQKVTVTVNPGPAAPVIATHPAATLCGNAAYVNFGADAPPAAGISYAWSATNATVVASGGDRQYAVVTFNNAGTAVVTLTSRYATTGCITSTSYTVNVGTGANDPAPEVIYFEGQFICKQTSVDGYQWGYDNAATLDSTVLTGETNQNYANAYPDFTNYRYWVMTTHNGCTQKTYYNKPTGVAGVSVEAGIKVFPNPANSYINVEISDLVTGNINVEVSNMLGQKLGNVIAVDNKAQISVADLPAGVYLVDCFSDGVKIAAARFIKN